MLKPKLLILLFACLSLCAEPNVRVHEPWSSSLSQENVDRWKQFTINREGLSAIELCDLADALIKSHKYPQAEAVLLQLETRDEMPFYSRAQLGFVYSWQKRNAEASEQFLDALKVKPCNDEVTAGLREVAGQLRLEEPTREEAIASYRALLKCNPDNAEELFFLGQLLSWTGKWVEAEKLLKRSLEIDPGYSDAEIQLGLLYFWQRRYTKAEEILYRYPRTPAANEAYLKIQEIFEARSSDDRVVTSPPLTPQVYADDERQIEIEKAEVEADPEDADARTRLARLYMLTGQLELARQTLLKSVELDPNLYASRVQLGYLYLTFKEYDLAYTEFTEAARLGGCEQELVNGYYEVAFEFMKDPKRIDQTEKILRQLMRCQPSNWAFMVDYGKLLEYQGQTKEAEAYYRKALRRNDSSVYAKLELAQLYVNLGDLEPAKKIYDSLPDERGAEIGLEKIQLIEGNYPTQDEIEYYPLIVKHPMYFDHTSRLGPAIEKVDSLPLPKAMRLYYLARLYLMIGDLDRAQSALRNAVRVNPGYVDAHTQLGYVYMWQKDYKRAGFQFEKAFSLQKCNADAVRGMIELGQEVVLEPSFHNYAIYLYEKAATCRRLTADENYQLGRLYAWNGKWELAEERLLEAITQDKKHKLATEQLGNLYLWQFRLDEAKDMFGRFPLELTFQRGVERSEFIQSDYTELLRVTLAQVISVPIPNYQYAKLFEKEIEEFKEANPGYWEDPSKLFTLAQLNLLAGNNNTARNLLFEMTLIDPDSIDARLQLGYSYLWEQNYHQAFNYFTEVLKQSPCNDLAIAGYEQLGQAWNQRRPTYKKALGIYNTLRACEPNDTTYLVQAGRLYAFTGSRAKGRKLVEEALEIDPYSFDAEMMYGIFLFWDRKFEEALEIFRRYPHQPYAILHVAKVQQAQDELEAAEQTLREAIADFPKNKELRFLLAQILRSQLRYYAAQKYLDELVIEDPDDERFWNDSFYNKDHVSPTILGRGSLTYSKEGDPDLDKIIVVSTKYKSSSLKYILPVQDRLTLHATGFYYTEKENNEVRKGIVNYNVYAQGGAFGVDLIATKEIDLKGSCRFKTAGQIGQTVFPFTASGSHVTHIEPAFRFSYTPGYFSFSGSYFYDSFFIKNFSIDRAQLLGKHTIDGAMKIKIPHFERFNVSTDFDLAWYFDNLKNRRVGRSVRVQIPVPFTENTSAIYEYTYGSFAKISPNYNSYKRRQTNSIEILFKKLYNYQTEYGFSWERKWKVSLDESVPVGLIDIELAGNKTRSDRFQGYINYRFQDHLKAQFEMSYLNNNFPYISKSFKGSLEWRF